MKKRKGKRGAMESERALARPGKWSKDSLRQSTTPCVSDILYTAVSLCGVSSLEGCAAWVTRGTEQKLYSTVCLGMVPSCTWQSAVWWSQKWEEVKGHGCSKNSVTLLGKLKLSVSQFVTWSGWGQVKLKIIANSTDFSWLLTMYALSSVKVSLTFLGECSSSSEPTVLFHSFLPVCISSFSFMYFYMLSDYCFPVKTEAVSDLVSSTLLYILGH